MEKIKELRQGKGIVTTIQSARGFGFIRQDDGEDIFFHASGVCSPQFKDLREGYQVEYQVVEVPKNDKIITKAIGIVAI